MREPIFDLDSIIRRRGFLWKSFEIYGGTAGFYDYGPTGTLMRNNILNVWRRYFVLEEGFVEIDTPNITPEEVFRASGHLEKFVDIMVECEKCHEVYRADHLIEEFYPEITHRNPETLNPTEMGELFREKGVVCPSCGGELGHPYYFNLMFATTVGRGKNAYLHPETAQGIFVNFQNLYRHFREKMPFGAAQVGRGFRNEISPRQGVIRMREFNMAELEVFVKPDEVHYPGFEAIKNTELTLLDQHGSTHHLGAGEAVENGIIQNEALAYFIARTQAFLLEVGVSRERLRFRQHEKDEMAHYAEDCWDAELLMRFNERENWVECVGIANRSCFDLEQHMKETGADLRAFERFETPREEEVERLKPDLRALGRAFRRNAPAVKEYLESLTPPFPEEIRMEIEGEEVEITPEYYTVEKRIKRVTGRRYIPAVIEPSFGLDRILYGVLQHSFHVGKARDGVDSEGYAILRLPAGIAPYQAAVFPLFNRPGMREMAREIYSSLGSGGIHSLFDDSGSIGKRYARQDEIGTPYCITVDHESLEDSTVTIRDRDSTEQVRVRAKVVPHLIRGLVKGKVKFSDIETGGDFGEYLI